MNKYFLENKIRKYQQDIIDEYLNKNKIQIVTGLKEMEKCTGYRYNGAVLYSFTEIHEAAVISMTKGEELSWYTDRPAVIPENGCIFIFEYAMGNGAAYPQPNGAFEMYINDKKALSFSLKKHNHIFYQNNVKLYLEIKLKKTAVYGECFTLDEFIQNECTAVSGVAYLHVPACMLDKNRLSIRIKPVNNDKISKRWFRTGWPVNIELIDIHDGLNAILNGINRPSIDGMPVYFGDIHVHSGETTYHEGTGCGRAGIADNYMYARDVAGLDFCAVSEHDWQMNAADWTKLRQVTDSLNEDDRFVTLHAFEWTSPNYGHRNIYFRKSPEINIEQTAFDYRKKRIPVKYGGGHSESDNTPLDLWNWLRENKFEAITVPHHPNCIQFPLNPDYFFNEQYDRAVEVYSNWGSLIHADHPINLNVDHIKSLDIGCWLEKHAAFIASSDSHDGCAGDSNVCNSGNLKHFPHYLGSGKVAVFCNALTRENVFDAIYDRHCYAVTGEPILMSFKTCNYMMGDIIKNQQNNPVFEIYLKGTDIFKEITIYKNGKPANIVKDIGMYEYKFSWVDNDFNPSVKTNYFLEAVQADGEMAWSSPVWFEPDNIKGNL